MKFLVFIAILLVACSKKPAWIPPLPDVEPLERVDLFYEDCSTIDGTLAHNCDIVGYSFDYDFSVISEENEANGDTYNPNNGMLVCFTPVSFAKLQGYQDAILYFDEIIRMKGDEVLAKLKWKIGQKFTKKEYEMIEKAWREFNAK